MSDKISFVFPAKTEFISAIRLAASGVACSFDFNMGKIEDIKSCIAEACLLLMCEQTCDFLTIHLECNGEIRALVRADGARSTAANGECLEFNAEMSKIMIEALAQDATFIRQDDIFSEVYFVISQDSEE